MGRRWEANSVHGLEVEVGNTVWNGSCHTALFRTWSSLVLNCLDATHSPARECLCQGWPARVAFAAEHSTLLASGSSVERSLVLVYSAHAWDQWGARARHNGAEDTAVAQYRASYLTRPLLCCLAVASLQAGLQEPFSIIHHLRAYWRNSSFSDGLRLAF